VTLQIIIVLYSYLLAYMLSFFSLCVRMYIYIYGVSGVYVHIYVLLLCYVQSSFFFVADMQL